MCVVSCMRQSFTKKSICSHELTCCDVFNCYCHVAWGNEFAMFHLANSSMTILPNESIQHWLEWLMGENKVIKTETTVDFRCLWKKN
jgi:hypothetical protein